MRHLLTLLAILLCKTAIVCVNAQTLATYPFPSIYTQSVNYTLKVNGVTIPVIHVILIFYPSKSI